MIANSMSPSRLNTDPAPWISDKGERFARYTDALKDSGARWGADYAIRPEYIPAQTAPTNPILDIARDDFDGSDPWGFAAEMLYVCGRLYEPIPDDAAEDGDSGLYAYIAPELASLSDAEREAFADHAWHVFDRMERLARLAGLNY